ncbi:MAG: NarK/NasA family nitrate transporter [Lentisphaeraceae bacterium]|nr:NarK/NasA family nitrate transporter [Lentisphaeraceae bacterium]
MEVDTSKSNRMLSMNTLGFTISFMVWLMYGMLINYLTKTIEVDGQIINGLIPELKGWEFFLSSIPILTGSIMRMPIGVLTDKYGGRPVFTGVLLLSSLGALMASYSTSLTAFIIAGLTFGMAGTAFAVGIAYSSIWFSKKKQGFALGIFGAGNAGAALTAILAPRLLKSLTGMGTTYINEAGVKITPVKDPHAWTQVPLIYAAIIFTMAIVFFFCTENRKSGGAAKSLAARLQPLKNLQVWRFGMYYFLLFGGFVALSLTLKGYYEIVYGKDLIVAGYFVFVFALLSAGFRAVGGWLSDKYGARAVMYGTLVSSITCCAILSFPLPIIPFAILSSLVGIIFGIGMAAVYKHIPSYFPNDVPVVGAMVGVIGGLGGFILPNVFKALLKATDGQFTSSWMSLTAISIIALIWMKLAIRNIKKKELTAQEA